MSKKSDKIKHQEENLESIESALTKTEIFLEKYQKQIIYVLGGVVLVITLGMLYTRKVVEPKELEAQSEIYQGELYFEQDSFRLALEGDGSYLGFLSIIDDYGSTKTGNLANYYAGISYLHLGDYESALEYLENFSLKGAQVSAVALGAIGDCYLQLGQTSKAISSYQKAADIKNDLTTPIHLQKLGVAYEIDGNNDKAVEVYESIKTAYPNSTEAREIDKLIARAKAV